MILFSAVVDFGTPEKSYKLVELREHLYEIIYIYSALHKP